MNIKHTDKRTETHACDLIRRQDAIDAADRADYTGLAVEDVKKVTDEVIKELKQLPSAQPNVPDINVGDMISRQDAVDVCMKYNGQGHIWSCIMGDIEQLPSAEPERKTGRWTIEDVHSATYKYCCSECKAHHRARYDFCPTCGAKMEVLND